MLASYIARNYAMYALANNYHGTNLVVPSYFVPNTPQYPITPGLSAGNMCSVPSPDEDTSMCTTTMRTMEDTMEELEEDRQVKSKLNYRDSQCQKPEIKFSIDRILSKTVDKDVTDKAQNKPVPCKDRLDDDDDAIKMEDGGILDLSDDGMKYSWLQCTRYKPPKLQRIRKKDGGKKRKLGRNPRVPFTQYQVAALEQKFCQTHYLSSIDVAELSTALNLTETRVKIWFQNRRARERRDRDSELRNCPGLTQGVPSSQALSFKPQHSGASSSWGLNIPTPHTSLSRLQKALHRSTSAFTPVSFSGSCNSP